MSDAIGKTGCISHRPNSHFFVMYEDFLDVAKISDHQYKLAAFWRVLETKYNERKIYNDELVADAQKKGLPQPETNLWIEIPYSEFEHRTLGTYKSSSFKIAAAESERLGFSQSRVQKRATNPLDPQSPKVDYKEYLFLVDAMQTVLNTGVYPTPVEFDSPLLKGYETREKKRKEKITPVENDTPPVEFNTGNGKTPVENDSTPLSNSTTNNIDIVSSKDTKDGIVATAHADANATPTLSENTQEAPVEQPEEKPKKRATRKPRAKKFEMPSEYQDRVNKVYEHLDTWRQKITGDPEEHFSHDSESDQSICSLFDGKPPTPKKLEQVCDALWNEPRNSRTGYWAREHMTIPFICKQYKAKSIVLATSEKKPQTPPTSYSVGGYTYDPEQEVNVPELTFAGPFRNRNNKRRVHDAS